MKKINRLVPFLLIFIICLISVRFLFFISYIQFQKSNLRAQLVNDKSAEILELTFNEKDLYQDQKGFEWKENNKELVINGKYFEVLKTDKLDGKILLSVIADSAENELMDNFFGLNKTCNRYMVNLIQLLLNLIYVGSNFDFHFQTYSVPSLKKTITILFSKNSFILKQIQPPEVFLS